MKTEYVEGLWERAVLTLRDANTALSYSPDNTANRAYYAAFYAVSALFAVEDRFFKKHSGLRAAVHKELVHTKRWPPELGADYNELYKLREVADYGILQHASHEEAADAIERAKLILQAVADARPDTFDLKASNDKTGG